jgi:predicted nucleic acid-binding protein
MARVLLDTNICLRFADANSGGHEIAARAVHRLILNGHRIRLTPQVLIEFWAVATRPIKNNGLEWTTSRTEIEIDALTSRFGMLGDRQTVLPLWRNLVTSHDVKGKNTHDARIAAVMSAHGVEHLLTFNGDDFKRFPHVRVLAPETVIDGTAAI